MLDWTLPAGPGLVPVTGAGFQPDAVVLAFSRYTTATPHGFLGLGAMTDFGPLIANPKTLLIGAGAQLGVFITFTGTVLAGLTLKEAASVGIIGGADGPTTVYLTQHLAPQLLGPNALAAYSYMAMVPLIQPPIMRLMTSVAERKIRMRQLRAVSKQEKILFPLVTAGIIALLVPVRGAAPPCGAVCLLALAPLLPAPPPLHSCLP